MLSYAKRASTPYIKARRVAHHEPEQIHTWGPNERYKVTEQSM